MSDLESVIRKHLEVEDLEWSTGELAVLDCVVEGLQRGRRVYGRLDLDTDPRDFSVETLEEIRDGIVYVCGWLSQARQRKARATRPLAPTVVESSEVTAEVDRLLDELLELVSSRSPDRDWQRELAGAARRWAERRW